MKNHVNMKKFLVRNLKTGTKRVLEAAIFQIVGRFHSWCLVFKNVGERSATKNYHPVSLLLAVLVFLLVSHLEKYGLFSDFKYGFRSSRSTADLLTVISDRIARAFNGSGTTQAVALDISKAFERV